MIPFLPKPGLRRWIAIAVALAVILASPFAVLMLAMLMSPREVPGIDGVVLACMVIYVFAVAVTSLVLVVSPLIPVGMLILKRPRALHWRRSLRALALVVFVLWMSNFFVILTFCSENDVEVSTGMGHVTLTWGDSIDSFGLNTVQLHEYEPGIRGRFIPPRKAIRKVGGGEANYVDAVWERVFGVWMNKTNGKAQAPLWPLFAPILALYFAAEIRCPRRDPNACLHCKYDLTGNTSGTCPECGTAIAPSSPPPSPPPEKIIARR